MRYSFGRSRDINVKNVFVIVNSLLSRIDAGAIAVWSATSIILTSGLSVCNVLETFEKFLEKDKKYPIRGKTFTGGQILEKVKNYVEAEGLENQELSRIITGDNRQFALYLLAAFGYLVEARYEEDDSGEDPDVVAIQTNDIHGAVTALTQEDKARMTIDLYRKGKIQKQADLLNVFSTRYDRICAFGRAALVEKFDIPFADTMQLNQNQITKACNDDSPKGYVKNVMDGKAPAIIRTMTGKMIEAQIKFAEQCKAPEEVITMLKGIRTSDINLVSKMIKNIRNVYYPDLADEQAVEVA